ncbi:MAG: hypothetical protein RIS92_2870 [Verrucomicrobiota bacterium]
MSFRFGGKRGGADFGERWEEVEVSGERGTVGWGDGTGPAPERVGACAADPGCSFGSAHVGVEDAGAGRSPVIVHEDDEGIFADSPFVEFAEDAPDVFVDVMDHSEEALCVVGEFFVRVDCFILWSSVIRAVGSVGWDVSKKWFSCVVLGFDPARGLGVKNVGAVALCFFKGSVVEDGGVEVGVCGGVAAGAWVDLPDSATAVDKHFAKSALVGLVGWFVSEVPFPEDAGGISCMAENFRERYGL